MTEQTLISENPAELFRSRVTRNFRSQFLQTSSVTARQYYTQASRWISFANLNMGVGFANVFPNWYRETQRFAPHNHHFFGLTSRFSRISFREFSRKLYRHHQTHQIFHHLHLFRQSHRPPLRFFQ